MAVAHRGSHIPGFGLVTMAPRKRRAATQVMLLSRARGRDSCPGQEVSHIRAKKLLCRVKMGGRRLLWMNHGQYFSLIVIISSMSSFLLSCFVVSFMNSWKLDVARKRAWQC